MVAHQILDYSIIMRQTICSFETCILVVEYIECVTFIELLLLLTWINTICSRNRKLYACLHYFRVYKDSWKIYVQLIQQW